LPFCHGLTDEREVEDLDLDVVGADGDPLGDVLDELPLLLLGEVGPAGGEVLGLGDDLVAGEVLDAEEVELALEGRDLVFQLLPALLHRPVFPAEAVLGDLVGKVELHHPVHLVVS
jgi:hypothetical protein